MKTIGEISRLSGVSIRALRHYDAIGLLRPTAVTEAGYRLYDDAAIEKLGHILLLRELEFPLAEIRRLLDGGAARTHKALGEQIALLEKRRDRLSAIIRFAKNLYGQGENTMDFSAFDKDEQNRLRDEAKKRWGQTDAWREFEARGGDGREDGLMAIFARFGAARGFGPGSDEAAALARELQSFITAHYYTCTDEILANLGEMYCADERFKANIDGAGGPGTAEFVRSAIRGAVNR